MPQAWTKVVEVIYVPLTDSADCGAALDAALEIGYRGQVTAYKDDAGAEVWGIELAGPGNPKPVLASVGDIFVWNGTSLEAMSQEQFNTRFTTSPGS